MTRRVSHRVYDNTAYTEIRSEEGIERIDRLKQARGQSRRVLKFY